MPSKKSRSPYFLKALLRCKFACMAILLGGGFLAVGTVDASILNTRNIADVQAGSKLTTTTFNSLLRVMDALFWDDGMSPMSRGFGTTIDPTVLGGNGNCPAGYTHVDFNNNGYEDSEECWQGLLARSGQLGIGTMNPSSELEVVGTIKATAFEGSGAWLTDLTTSQLTDWSTATNPFITSTEFGILTTGWDKNDADDYDSADFVSDFELQTTDELTEGASNLYFTDPRTVAAIGGALNDLGSSSTDLWSAFKIRDYIESNGEDDPIFTAWDKSTGITITESQISDLTHYTDADIDGTEAAFTGWDKDASDDFDGVWGSLTGIPADIADGDDDTTIADGLTCSIEQILKWNGTAWECTTFAAADDQTATEVTATDNFDNSDGTDVQTVLEDLDGVITTNSGLISTNAANISDNTTDIALKADINSPTFTGDPKAPTATLGDSDTSIATTGFVVTEIASATAAFVETEFDPVFTAWDKSTGISITSSQVSDFSASAVTAIGGSIDDAGTGTTDIWSANKIALELANVGATETDPIYTAWDKSTGISITESQISDLQSYITSESDPVFLSWDKKTGITINESQILDLQAYLTSESDPIYTAWDKSSGISIETSQISDWDDVTSGFVVDEIDPIFVAWDKSTGITITESQITDLDHYTSIDFLTDFNLRDTDDLAEGTTNRYFADTLAINAIGGSINDSGTTTTDLWSADKISTELAAAATVWNTSSGDIYRATGNVGIGVNPPLERLDVDGGIRIGNSTGTNAGTIRWTGTELELYDGTAWKSFAGGIADARKEHSGFPNRTDSIIAFVDGTRTFTISPVGASFDYYQYDEKFTVTAPDSIVIPNSMGIHYVYYEGDTLKTTQTITSLPQTSRDWVMVAVINWDGAKGVSNFFADERHGLTMDWATKTFIHNTMGTMWVAGLGLHSMTVDGAGSVDSSVQFGVQPGQILDEDNYHTIAPFSTPAVFPIFYREGTDQWKSRDTGNIQTLYQGDGEWGSGQRLPYNFYNDTGATVDGILDGEWGLREVPDGEIVLVHYFATTDATGTRGVIGLQGQQVYDTADHATAGASTELAIILSEHTAFDEFAPIATVLFETDDTYTNTAKARIISTSTGDDYIDLRAQSASGGKLIGTGGSSSGTGEHGDLAGLNDDHHLQYALLAGRSAGQTLIGGTDATDDLTLRSTSGVGTTDSDIIFQVGNDGATEAMRIDGSGTVGIGGAPSAYQLDVNGTLQSDSYTQGTQLSLQSVASGQSAVSAWWGLQLVGNQQSNVDAAPSNYGAADDFSVMIPNQQASKTGLVVRGAASQTGNLTEWQDSAGVVLTVVDENGHIGVGVTDPTVEIDVAGTVKATTFVGDGSQLTGLGMGSASEVTISAVVSEVAGITAGQCVYISGASGGTPTVSLCDNTVQEKIGILGLSAETKLDTETILIRVAGELTGVDTSAWSEGDTLYMGTGGALTNVLPTTGSIKNAGRVAYSHATAGTIFVSPGIKEWYVSAADGQDVDIRMGDAAGVTSVSFEDNTDTEVAYIDSNGNSGFVGELTVDTLTATTITGMVIGTDVAAAGANSDITSLTGLQTSIVYSGAARPTRQVTLSPEYAGSTMTGDGTNNTGMMSSDFCTNTVGGLPDIGTAVCTTAGDIHNYYNWTNTQPTPQDYDIIIRWRVPDNFSSWAASDPISAWAKRTDATNNAVEVFVYDTANTLDNIGGTQIAGTSWTETSVASSLTGTYTPGQYITIQIKLTADTGDDVQVGEISLDYLSTN